MPGWAQTILNYGKDAGEWALDRVVFTRDLIARAQVALPSAATYSKLMEQIYVNRGKEERKIAGIWQQFERLKTEQRNRVNDLLAESTIDQEWAFVPEHLRRKDGTLPPGVKMAEANSKIARTWKAMSEQEQAVVRAVFVHGHEQLVALREAVLEGVRSEHDAAIKKATDDGDVDLVAKLEAQKIKAHTELSDLLNRRSSWPYAPLGRFGRWAVVGTSEYFRELEQTFKDTRDAEIGKELRALQSDPNHYHVEFAETKKAARARQQALDQTGLQADFFERTDDNNMLTGGRDVLSAFTRLRNVVKDETGALDGESASKLDEIMRTVHLELLSETSARKAEVERRKVAGYSSDMMRAFVSHGRAQAAFVGALSTTGEVAEALRGMSREAQERGTVRGMDRTKRMALFNEILRRHQASLEYKDEPMIDGLMAMTSGMMLLTNPAYYVGNMLQPWMMTLPTMAGRHGMTRSANALLTASRELVDVLAKSGGKFTEDSYQHLPDDVRAVVERLANEGKIDIALGTELGDARSERGSAATRHLRSAEGMMKRTAEAVEAVNRVATAIAAYRMEIKKQGASPESAHAYASKMIYETHGDYSGYNAPRFMRSGPMRLVTQFRKFQLIQLSMYGRLFHTWAKDADPEARREARNAIMYNFSMMAAAGGAMGLPAFSAVAFLVSCVMGALGDDTPDDPESTMRRMVPDKLWGDLLVGGIPKALGVSLTSRVGAGGMLSLLPYTDIDFSRKGYEGMVLGASGALVGGLGPRMFDGVDAMAKGDFWRGFASILPGIFGNATKASGYLLEGVKRKSGDVVLTPDEVSFFTFLGQTLGLPTNTLTDRNFLANAEFKARTYYDERKQTLMRKYREAWKDGDRESMDELKGDWVQMQRSMQGMGLKPPELKTLVNAPKDQAKREGTASRGMIVKKDDKAFIDQLAGMIDG